jgi:hypothetical protein
MKESFEYSVINPVWYFIRNSSMNLIYDSVNKFIWFSVKVPVRGLVSDFIVGAIRDLNDISGP